jgi:hypothetical protein
LDGEKRKNSRNDEQTSEMQEDTPFSIEKTMIYTLTDTPEMILKAETEKEKERHDDEMKSSIRNSMTDGKKKILEKRALPVRYKKPD